MTKTPAPDAAVSVEHPCYGIFPSSPDKRSHRHWFQNNELMPTCERCGTLIDRNHNEVGPVRNDPPTRLAALAPAGGDYVLVLKQNLELLAERDDWTGDLASEMLWDAKRSADPNAAPPPPTSEPGAFLAATGEHHIPTAEVGCFPHENTSYVCLSVIPKGQDRQVYRLSVGAAQQLASEIDGLFHVVAEPIEPPAPDVLAKMKASRDKYMRLWRAARGQIVDLQAAPITSEPAADVDGLRAAANKLLRMRVSIETDVRSCHSMRGNGASSEMRSDDRDMRSDLSDAFDRLAAALSTSTAAGEGSWRPMSDTEWLDGRDVILLAHDMVVSARYCAGEWSEDTPVAPAEYSGAVWSCFDDQFQFEIEEVVEDAAGWWHGPVTGWMPALAKGGDAR